MHALLLAISDISIMNICITRRKKPIYLVIILSDLSRIDIYRSNDITSFAFNFSTLIYHGLPLIIRIEWAEMKNLFTLSRYGVKGQTLNNAESFNFIHISCKLLAKTLHALKIINFIILMIKLLFLYTVICFNPLCAHLSIVWRLNAIKLAYFSNLELFFRLLFREFLTPVLKGLRAAGFSSNSYARPVYMRRCIQDCPHAIGHDRVIVHKKM